jgi:Flp pilus assembly protein TadG
MSALGKPITGRSGRSRGQAMAEFALVAPIFFFLLFGIIDFGRYVYYVQILNNAAREGARYAIVHGYNSLNRTGPPDDPNGAAVVAIVRQYATGVIGDSTQLDITPTWWAKSTDPQPNAVVGSGDGSNTREDVVQVIVTYQFQSVIPIVPIPPIEVKGSSTLVINN